MNIQIIDGWTVWDAEAWCVDYTNIYPTKEQALEAASKHYSYFGDDEITDACICRVKIKVH